MAVERTRTTAQATAEGLRIFASGIPLHIREDTLQRDFGECGLVEDLFLMRDPHGRSRGRCFVTFREKDAVEAAMKYHNTEYSGKVITVKFAEAKMQQKTSKGGGEQKEQEPKPKPVEKSFPTEKPRGCKSLCLKNLGAATEDDVRKLLKGCSAIQSIRLVTDRETGTSRGVAFVDFSDSSQVDEAMKQNGKEVKGNAVTMTYEAPRERPRPDGCLSVAVKKLPAETKESHLKELFSGLKSLKKVRVIRRGTSCMGLAFADFGAVADVEAAVERDGMKVLDSVVFVCYETKAAKTEANKPKKKTESKLGQQAESGEVKKKKGRRQATGNTPPTKKPKEEAQPKEEEKKGAKRKRGKQEAKEAQVEEQRGTGEPPKLSNRQQKKLRRVEAAAAAGQELTAEQKQEQAAAAKGIINKQDRPEPGCGKNHKRKLYKKARKAAGKAKEEQ